MKAYRHWKLTTKVMVPVGAALALVTIGASAFIYQQQMGQVRSSAAKMAHALALQIAEDRTYYTKNVLGKLRADGLKIVPNDSRFHQEKGGIPLPATFVKEITEEINKKGYYKADLISTWPINKAKGPRNQFERDALAALAKDPKKARETVVDEQGRMRLVYVAADVAGAAACVACHNTHPESPKKDFALGDVMGGLVVEVPITAETAAAAANAWTMIVGMTLIFAAILTVVFVIVRRFIQRPIIAITPLFEEMAQGGGDLTIRLDVKGHDEVGTLSHWFNEFMDKLRDVMAQVTQGAGHVTTASRQLSAASDQLSAGAQGQASSLEETAASLEEITGTVKQNADNARQANQLAAGSRDTAEKGGQVVTSAVEAMNEINKSSKKIADIITTIDEIAFQTNLLALNAAVEAARAGEQGRGFAVVAAEVRNLAQRSATAAKEIKALIEDSVGKVEVGSELVNKSGETLREIVTSVKRVTDIIAEIAAASHEQSTGIDQVNRAVTQMDQVTQGNAAQTEELASTAQALSGQAEQLQTLVARFKLDDAVGHAEVATPAQRATRPRATAARNVTSERLAVPALAGNGSARARDDGFEEF